MSQKINQICSGYYEKLLQKNIFVSRFNEKPKDGIKFLQDRQLLRSTPAEVAEWLHAEERLDKAAIGNFLGEAGEFSREVAIYPTLHSVSAFLKFLPNFTQSLKVIFGFKHFIQSSRKFHETF